MEDRKKAIYLMSKFQALSNAAEFIRSHGEEGHSYEDEEFNIAYLKETKILANQLNKRAYNYVIKYTALDIHINTQVD